MIEVLCLKTIGYDCDLELELNWDPTTNITGAHEMSEIEQLYWNEAESPTLVGDTQETFLKHTAKDEGFVFKYLRTFLLVHLL